MFAKSRCRENIAGAMTEGDRVITPSHQPGGGHATGAQKPSSKHLNSTKVLSFNLYPSYNDPCFILYDILSPKKTYKELKAYKSLEICIPRTFDILRWMLQFTCDQELRWWGRERGCFGYFLPSLTFAVCTWWVGGSGCWGLHILERD